MRMRNPGKYLLAGCVVTSVLVAAPLALGAGEGRPMDGGARNPSNNSSQAYTQETQIISNVSTYGTRQSNKSDDGGGAIYGCRATNTSSNTCVRATNLANGQAFSFNANGGNQVGSITSSNKSAAPFTTNATGVATGLNADNVDGLSAQQIQSAAVQSANLFATISAGGTLGASRGVAAVAQTSTGVYTVTTSETITSCAFAASPSSATPATATVYPVDSTHVQVRTFVDSTTTGPTQGIPAPASVASYLTITC
jgi:hypothetical protein